jgi:hypothetical protein
MARREGPPLAQRGIHHFLEVAPAQAQPIPHEVMIEEGAPAACVPREGWPLQMSVPPAHLRYASIRDTAVLGAEFSGRGPAPGSCWATPPGQVRVAR